MERQYILHMFTPGRQASPFDVNMAVDAGYQVVVPYADVGPANVTALTQDAIFSRGPKATAFTGIFIGGRDVIVAADMLDAARKAMVPPFEVSVFADPSGSYTTAAAMIACVERHLKKAHGSELKGKRVLVLGGTGAVGRIAGVLAAQLGAVVTLSSHSGLERARTAADETNRRFGSALGAVAADSTAELRAALAEAEVVCATAAAGVQVMSESDVAAAPALLAAADVNAVPPAGIGGVGVFDDGKPIAGAKNNAVGIGALAIGNVKYQTQHRLFVQMREASKPVYLGIAEALAVARQAAGGA
jgi:methylene-tetrahydromethanopterin dehydrogenase